MINPLKTASIEQLNKWVEGNMVGYLGIVITETGDDYIKGKMPVNEKTKQPLGILHGGASVVLAESLGSIGSFLLIDSENEFSAGMEVNANHVRSAFDGYVYAKATIVHKGKKTHIWDIRITNESDELICISRLTVAVSEKRK